MLTTISSSYKVTIVPSWKISEEARIKILEGEQECTALHNNGLGVLGLWFPRNIFLFL